MKGWLRIIGTALTLGAAVCSARGSEPVRPVSSAWMVEVGTSHLADTYLSPVKYSGLNIGLTYSRLQAMKRTSLVQGWDLAGRFDRAVNPSGNASMLELRIEGSWRIMRRWRLPHGFSAAAGGSAAAEFGALYLGRNGNNPAQAIASVNIGPELMASWSGRIGKLPVAARWHLSAPLIGAFFCPDYGELYYEIALGNHSGLAHCGWPGNYRRLRSLVCVDLNLGKTTLRLGYRFDGTSTDANHITSRRIEHAAVIGVVCDFVTLNTRKHDAQTVTAYY